MSKMAKQEVAKANTTAMTTGGYDYGDAAGEGFEGLGANDLSIPFLTLMQSNSVLVEDETNEIKAGDIVNSVTGEVMKQPIIIHPCLRDHLWAEWVPRAKGGGRGDSHDDNSPLVQSVIKANSGSRIPPEDADGKRNPFKTPAGLDLIETFYYYVMIMDADGVSHEGFAIIPFSSTKIKVQKDWTSSMFMVKGRPPLVASRAVMTSVKQLGKGKTFYNLSIRPFGETWTHCLIKPDEAGMALMNEAREFKNMIESGAAKPAQETQETDGSAGGAAASGGLDNDEKIPF
jgi:hypothetical protein